MLLAECPEMKLPSLPEMIRLLPELERNYIKKYGHLPHLYSHKSEDERIGKVSHYCAET